MFGLYIMGGIVFMAFVTRPFIVLLHEMGHAVPALLFTSQPVAIYIGSYGDPTKSKHVRLGRLTIWVQLSLFWKAGLCISSQQKIPVWQQAIIVLSGPIASLLVAGIGCYFIFNYNLHSALKLLITAFAFFALLDLTRNLIPNSTPITINDGRVTYNDGQLLKRLWYYPKFSTEYEKAVAYINSKQYQNAHNKAERLLALGFTNSELYELAILCKSNLRQYQEALVLYQTYAENHAFTSEMYGGRGLLKSRLGLNVESIDDYNDSLRLNPDNIYSSMNKAYTLNLMGCYSEAILLFDQLIELQPDSSYSYSNRGLAKIKQGAVTAGLADIYHSLELDSTNAYAHRNLGIYQLEQQDSQQAMKHFLLAQALDPDTHLLVQLIAYTTQLCK